MTEVRIRAGEFAGTERFEVRRRLGYGGFGIVYEAYDRERDMVTALKTLRRMSPTSLYRFKREFRALADVADANLVTLYELLSDGDEWFFTMELIDGVSFLEFLGVRPAPTAVRGPSPAYPSTRGMTTVAGTLTGSLGPGVAETVVDDGTDAVVGRPPPPAPPVPHAEPCRDYAMLRRTALQLASGLSALHRAGKLHRDIKPTNVLVERGGRVVLLDFGLVAERGSAGARTGRPFEGTPAYASPEQAVGAPVGTETDWFSVGVMLYEALTGALPHAGTDLEILLKKQHTDPPAPRDLDPAVPEDLSALCAALLARDPDARPDAAEVLARLGGQERRATDSGRMSAASASALPFVGRTEELAQLDWAFDDAAAGSPVVAIVSGASGIGKSALVLEHLERLRARTPPPVMLLGRCFERESVPYKAFDGVVDALTRHLLRREASEVAALLPDDVGPLARLFPVLRRLPLIDRAASASEPVTDPDRLRQRAFSALRDLLGGLANRGAPLVLAIDDFQWADADSRALLREVMRPGVAPPVLLVATLRTPPAAESMFHTLDRDARALGLVRHIPVEALSPADSSALARTLLADGPDAISADSIAHESSGHPLFIHELVRHHADADPSQDRGAVDLDRALGERVSRLEPGARRLLEVVVLAGSPLAQPTVAKAAGLDTSTFSRLLAGLRVGNLARTSQRHDRAVEPFHDRIRKAVTGQLDEHTRRRHHAALAAALLEDTRGDGHAHLLVQHLHASGESRRASAYAHRAAERAARAFAFDQAAELFRRALELGAFDPEDGRALRMQLADALVNAGRGPEAADEYLAAAVDAAPQVRMRCRRIAAEQLLTSGHIERGMGVLDALLRQVDRPLPSSSMRAAAALIRQRAVLRARGLAFTERPRNSVDAHERQRIEVLRSVAFGLGVVDNVRAALYQTRAVLDAMKLGEPRLVGECFGAEAVFMGCQSVAARTRARATLVARTRDLGARYDDALCRAWTAGANSSLDFFHGDLMRAIDTLAEAETLFRDHTTGNAWPIDSVRHFRAMCLRILGRFGEVRRVTDEIIEEAQRRGNRYVASSLRRGRTAIWLAADDTDRVRAELAEATWTPWQQGFHVQHFLALEAECELALYEGRTEDAYAQYAPQFRAHALSMGTRVQMIRCLDAGVRGRLLLARAAGARRRVGDLARVRWIAARFDREGVSYARVFAALLRAGIAAVEGDDAACRDALRRGIHAADAAGMEFHAAAARVRLADRVEGATADALRAHAAGWLGREHVRRPERLIAMALPGF